MAEEQAGVPASGPMSMTDRIAAAFGVDADEEPSTAPEGPEGVSANAEEAEPEQTEQEAEEPAKDSGYEDVELDGETYRVPPKLKEAVLRQSDYTRKTQELAEHRRTLATQVQAVQMSNAFQQETADDRAQLQALQHQIGLFKDVRWHELDSDTMIRTKHQLDMLKEQASELDKGLQQKAQGFQHKVEQLKTQFRNQRAESLQRMVPNWNQQSDIEATVAALNLGFTQDEIRDNFDARLGHMAWKAAQFDKLQQGKTAAIQAVKRAPPVIKPGSSNPMPTEVKQKLAYRKDISTAKNSKEREKIIAKRLEGMFR